MDKEPDYKARLELVKVARVGDEWQHRETLRPVTITKLENGKVFVVHPSMRRSSREEDAFAYSYRPMVSSGPAGATSRFDGTEEEKEVSRNE